MVTVISRISNRRDEKLIANKPGLRSPQSPPKTSSPVEPRRTIWAEAIAQTLKVAKAKYGLKSNGALIERMRDSGSRFTSTGLSQMLSGAKDTQGSTLEAVLLALKDFHPELEEFFLSTLAELLREWSPKAGKVSLRNDLKRMPKNIAELIEIFIAREHFTEEAFFALFEEYGSPLTREEILQMRDPNYRPTDDELLGLAVVVRRPGEGPYSLRNRAMYSLAELQSIRDTSSKLSNGKKN